ncbi:helix-turn-helix domain-containing protein [Streptomyces noursei]|uniref:helix-turn-helix domain-containing protein n=1 Tax=Streptomyces noursei TaxID=1971 RepID=UPI0033DBACDA
MTETTDPAEQARAALRARMSGHIDAALACLDEIGDPVERELAARILADDLLPDARTRVKAVRAEAVQELREERGLKLREVAELIGLSVPRVDQIAKGK